MKINGIYKSFKEKEVFRDFSLTIDDKKRTAILGESGKGKTTLVRIIAGLEKPDGGKVENADNRPFSMVFQEDRLLPFKTLKKNVMLVGANEEEAEKYLKAVGLGKEINSYPDELSGGMKRRTAIARALAYKKYKTLILDEPFNGQDPKTKEALISLIKSETEGKTVILITHSKEDAEVLCDVTVEL